MRGTLNAAVWLCCLLPSPGLGQAQPSIDTGFRQMYNLEFDAAHAPFAAYERVHPDDALAPAADAAAWLFAEFDRLHVLQSEFFLHDENFRVARKLTPDARTAREFERQLAKARELAQAKLKTDARDRHALLASMLVLGLRCDYDGLIERRYLSSLNASKQSRRMAEHILALDPQCYDAWVAIGVENYLLSLKPLPVRWFVQLLGNSADREYGIAKMRLVAEHGEYLKPFAQLLLAVAALRDKHPEQARALLARLAADYPQNHLYSEELKRLQ
jgi:hypothetical protein